MKNAMMFSGMGMELVMLCLGGYYLGDTISQHYGITKSVTAFIILALLVAWFVHLIYLLRKFEETDEETDQHSNSGGPGDDRPRGGH